MKTKDFWALNWLRFFLALYLVLFHTLNWHYRALESHPWLTALLDLGNLATSVFFVLSGFLLTHVYIIRKPHSEINLRNFLIARFSALYPLHVAGFLLAVVTSCLTFYVHGGIPVPTVPFGEPTRVLELNELVIAGLMNLALLNAWNPYFLIFNTPSWSLSALAIYYAIFPFVAPKLKSIKCPGLALFIMGILFALPGLAADCLHLTDLLTDGLLHRNPVVRLPLFLTGILLCVLHSRSSEKWERGIVSKGLLCTTIFITVIVASYFQSRSPTLHFVRNGLYFPSSVAIVWLCSTTRLDPSTNIRKWGVRLGGASLPIFLLHAPLFQFFTKLEKVFWGTVSLTGEKINLMNIIAAAQNMEQAIYLYPVYIISLVYGCLKIQEKIVQPLQQRLRERFNIRTVASKEVRECQR